MDNPYSPFVFEYKTLSLFCEKLNDESLASQSKALIGLKRKDLDGRWDRFQTSFRELMLSDQPDKVKESAQKMYDSGVDLYYATIASILDLIQPLGEGTESLSTKSDNTGDIFNTCLKLPPCDTQIFSGGYDEWPAFRDMFTAVYINHPRLKSAEKLYHLRNKTTDEAGAIVNRFPLVDDNFKLAWEALKSRYENTRVLVDNQIRNLYNIPIAKFEDSKSLQRIHSSVTDCLSMLGTLGISSEGWDPMIVNLVYSKLPPETLTHWEQSLNASRELPTWSQLSNFLLRRGEVVERISTIQLSKTSFLNHSKSQSQPQTYLSREKLNLSCRMCDENHNIRVCPKFRKLSVQERVDFVFKNRLCNNCLSSAHTKANCISKTTCSNCSKLHHTLLHMNANSNPKRYEPPRTNPNAAPAARFNAHHQALNPSSQSFRPQQTPITYNGKMVEDHSKCEEFPQVYSNYATNHTNILLRTALVQIEFRGEIFTIRALIDPGSERTFLSEKIRTRLNIPYRKSNFEIVGVGGQCQNADKECDLILVSNKSSFRLQITAIVLPRVTNKIPSASFPISKTKSLSDLDLADPHFNISSSIDLILGNDSERYINLDGIKRDVYGSASAYRTVFGWVLSGPTTSQPIFSCSSQIVSSENDDSNELLRKFWEQEEIPFTQPISAEDKYTEKFYTQTTKRLSDGRYMVRLPFKREFPESKFLGSSRFTALCQYSRLDQTLSKNPTLLSEYNTVLHEYLTLDHMEPTTPRECFSNGNYTSFYLPHHAVIKPESKTTKLRVVFNASRKTKSGFSLNDVLYTGPTLQADLMSIILNWRLYKFVFSGDIQKMYRQILVHPQDRPFQRILFQDNPREAIKDYQLKTVTFGVNCAPFLAIRTLLQLAADNHSEFPKASDILRNETYVDDILTGGHSIEDAIHNLNQLNESLKSAGFLLKKITSNHSKVLESVAEEDLYDFEFLKFHDSSSTKTLGIRWNALTDSFTYTFQTTTNSPKITKRLILSSVAKLFDPAGWISPVIIRGKILIQQLWLEKSDWDDVVSSDSLRIWNEIITDLPSVEQIQIPRWIRFSPVDHVQVHGFCDASKLAYCAVVYIRVQSSSGIFSNLLVSKTKVAPLAAITLPRLELSGALMLAKLVHHTQVLLKLRKFEIYLWCDSSIVLGWLAKPPATWKEIYVSNRVSQIHKLLPDAKWRHVSTNSNPADLGSRGCRPQDLVNNSLWWQGPPWLINQPSEWPISNPLDPKKYHIVSNLKTCSEDDSGNIDICQSFHINTSKSSASKSSVDILENFSSYTRALRVYSYVFRYIRHFKKNFASLTHSLNPTCINLQQEEINSVKSRFILLAQQQHYPAEYSALLGKKTLSKDSSLFNMNPFLDTTGILRVNGRLANSPLPYKERFPIILPRNSRFCELYLKHLHTFLAHGECQLMCRMAQTEFHISRLKLYVRKIIRFCKTCIIYKKRPCSQIMAALPADRCSFSSPFNTVGIDFAGPFELKSSILRNSAIIKAYACVFVCFATKAVHLEPCSNLSADAFQATFARFVGRRGLPHKVYSDNGRNFVGASRALRKEFSKFLTTASQDIAQKYIIHDFQWSFIPPQAPHMGGLWESAVKSFKFHLKRIAGAHRFNYEEFATVLARIEGVLNSRPISAVSEDPTDLTALTPGHFLRGGPLLALPEPPAENLSLINRWEKLKALHHRFAIQWKAEYLKSLHKRYKWKLSSPNLSAGDFVIIMDDNLPPHEWRLGRIESVHKGPDQLVRVVDIHTALGTLTRPITKLCYLPFQDSTTENNTD